MLKSKAKTRTTAKTKVKSKPKPKKKAKSKAKYQVKICNKKRCPTLFFNGKKIKTQGKLAQEICMKKIIMSEMFKNKDCLCNVDLKRTSQKVGRILKKGETKNSFVFYLPFFQLLRSSLNVQGHLGSFSREIVGRSELEYEFPRVPKKSQKKEVWEEYLKESELPNVLVQKFKKTWATFEKMNKN